MNSRLKAIVLYLLELFCSCFPVQKKIVFINFNGRGFGCNPKYIALGCIEAGIEAELVWLVSQYYDDIPKEIKQVHWGSIRFYYELATAKVIITNVKNRLPFRKRKKQYLIQTWHGSHAYKMVEKEVEDMLSPEYVKDSKENSRITDLFISNSPLTSEWYRDAFYCNCEIAETGLPRDDILMRNSETEKKAIRKRLHIDEDTKLILYAPTFRNEGYSGNYDIDYQTVIHVMQKKFGGKWKILLRAHPNETWRGKIDENCESVINVSRWGDVQELCLISDILITDYSSICNDFIKMDKPVFLYVPDYEEYLHNNRTLKDNYYDLPLLKNRTIDELVKDIVDFNNEKYLMDVEVYKVKYQFSMEKFASAKVVEIIKEKL